MCRVWQRSRRSCRPRVGAGAGAGSCLEQASRFFYGGLATALAGVSGTSEPLGDLSDVCRSELYVDVQDWASSSPAGGDCTNAGGLLAVLRELASSYSAGAPDAAALFHRTLARLLAPHLLIAQDDLVRGVRESFLGGLGDQVELYRAALSLLSAPARLALEPRVLEFLRRTSARDAAGAEGSADASLRDYPRSVRSVASSTYCPRSKGNSRVSRRPIRQQIARCSFVRPKSTPCSRSSKRAPCRRSSRSGPPSRPGSARNSWVRSRLWTRGLGPCCTGAVLFGVPEGEIPLAFDAARPQPTNFEQMLLLRASPALAQQAASQTAFLSAERDFEQSQDTLAVELERVRYSHEATITAICGPAFSFEVTLQELDWQECGCRRVGELGRGATADRVPPSRDQVGLWPHRRHRSEGRHRASGPRRNRERPRRDAAFGVGQWNRKDGARRDGERDQCGANCAGNRLELQPLERPARPRRWESLPGCSR